ncbi:MAG TPA: DUF222 domain-containing protein, partial [Rhodanobacteraceae bacterium]|nr:DUF222 domain-containing protein [Rhodanobacteraceae bacterium]
METTESPSGQDNSASKTMDELASQIVAGAGRLAAATGAWLLLVADFDARGGAWKFGMASTAQWLSFHCGLAARTANDHVRVARALANFPKLAEGMAAGIVSYSHARAIARVAKPGEFRLVDDLLEVARYGTVEQLEVVARGLVTVDRNENRSDQAERERVAHRWGDDSMWGLSAKLDPERGVMVQAALEKIAAAEEISKPEALVRLAEIGLASLADADKPSRELRGDERAAVVIHLDVDRISSTENGSAEPTRPIARIDRGPGLPTAVVQRLLCDGRVRTLLMKDEQVLDVGRTHRLVTRKQFRALLRRQGGQCAHPGCPNTKRLHAHHVLPWLIGGPTDMDNLVLICERHHVSLHEGVYRIRKLGNGDFRFETPDGVDLAHPIEACSPADLPSIEAEHADVD